MASPSVKRVLRRPISEGQNPPIPRPKLYENPCPEPRTALGKSSDRHAPMPEKIPNMKKPSGKPMRNMPPATGKRVYKRIKTAPPTANTMKPRRRPIASVNHALTKYPPSEPVITINRYPVVPAMDKWRSVARKVGNQVVME